MNEPTSERVDDIMARAESAQPESLYYQDVWFLINVIVSLLDHVDSETEIEVYER